MERGPSIPFHIDGPLRIDGLDLPAVGLYVRTSDFIFFRIDNPISY